MEALEVEPSTAAQGLARAKESGAAEHTRRPAWSRPRTHALLTATLVLSYLDRQVLNSLFEPIKRELGLSDSQLGLLGGLAVTLFGTLFGVHIARFADAARHRSHVLTACLLAFSVATAASGASPGFGTLLCCRILVGVGEAGCIPISLAILADSYPQAQRSMAMSVYYMGLPGGILLGLFLGGWLSESLGWRYAFVAVGIPGIALALLVYVYLNEPARGFSDNVKPEGVEAEGAPLLRPEAPESSSASATAVPGSQGPLARLLAPLIPLFRSRTFVLVLFGNAATLFAAIGTFAWMPSLCERRFGTSTGVTGSALSGAMLFGALCTLAGGSACDAAFRRTGKLGVYARLPAFAVLLGFPFGVAMCVAPSFGATIALFLPPTLSANVPSGPLRCLISALIPASRRTVANSVLEIGVGLAGGLGPLVVGAISDSLQRRSCPSAHIHLAAGIALTEAERRCSAHALSTAMLSIQFASLPAFLCLFAASRCAERELHPAGGAAPEAAASGPAEKEEEIEERPPDAAVTAEAERVQAQIMATFAARKAARDAAGVVTTPSRAHRDAQLT